MALSPTFEWLIASRLLTGIAMGGSMGLDFVFFIEFSPSQKRGIVEWYLTQFYQRRFHLNLDHLFWDTGW
jgi:MFS family permease